MTLFSTPFRRIRWGVAVAVMLSMLAWSALLLVALAVLAYWLDPAFIAGAPAADRSAIRLALLNAIPAALIAMLVFALSRRLVAAFAIAGALYSATVTASSLKLAQLGMPLLPADFGFLGTSGGAALFSHYVDFAQLVVPIGLLVIGVLALCFEPRSWNGSPVPRVALGAIAMTAAITLVAGSSVWRATYDGWNSGFEPWSPAETVARMGVAPTLLMYQWELSRPDRKPPDRDRVLEFIAEHSAAFAANASVEANHTLPDIIVVQSESFFDTARMNGVSSEDATPNFHRLAARGRVGDMAVPTFAGGTIRTEFEVLSGVPLAAFPGVEYPYFELVDEPMPSLMSVLVEHGYTTTVLHPNDAGFWNRRDALARLGAQRFLALPEFADAPKSGLFIADSALTDRVLAEIDDDGPPQFLFAISIEAHGPYEVSPGLDAAALAAISVPGSLDEYGQRTLRHFTYHIANADRELGRLAEFVMRRERPTVLLFYGDHLPGLHSTFAQLGFVDGREARTQPVPYLFVDNISGRAKSRREDIASWMLPSVLLEAAGVPADAYLALVGALRSNPLAMQPDGPGTRPEPRFAELARLRVGNGVDAGELLAALRSPPEETIEVPQLPPVNSGQGPN